MMWKKLKSFFRKPARKRVLNKEGFERLEQKFIENTGFINVDYADVQILRKDEAAFLWESPPCTSMDEMISLAPLAAAEMAPERGRKIVSVLLYCNLPWEADIESLAAICSAIQRTIPEDADIVFGCEFGEECSFLLATSEGKCGSKPFDAAHDRSVMDERYEG